MYKILVPPNIDKVLKRWKKSNPILFQKYHTLYHELMEHPRTGSGHPEPLVGGHQITWSRRLSAHDRMVYDIYDDTVEILIIQIEGHYSDK